MNLNLNSTFAKSMNLNLFFSKSMNLNLKRTKKMNGSNLVSTFSQILSIAAVLFQTIKQFPTYFKVKAKKFTLKTIQVAKLLITSWFNALLSGILCKALVVTQSLLLCLCPGLIPELAIVVVSLRLTLCALLIFYWGLAVYLSWWSYLTKHLQTEPKKDVYSVDELRQTPNAWFMRTNQSINEYVDTSV